MPVPEWNLTRLYKNAEDPQIAKDFQFMRNWNESVKGRLAPDAFDPRVWEQILGEMEETSSLLSHLSCFVSNVNALRPQEISHQKLQGDFMVLSSEYSQVKAAFNAFLKNLGDVEFETFKARPTLKGLEFYLEDSRKKASYKTEAEKENLMTDMDLTGAFSWEELYSRLIASIKFKAVVQGEEKEYSMSQRRTLTEDPSPAIRKEVFHKSNAELGKQATTFAFCLNGIVGSRLTKMRHRRRDDFLEIGLAQGRMGQESLEALWEACRRMKPQMQSYLRWKEKFLGRAFGYYDMDAPLGKSEEQRFTWDQAWQMVTESFSLYPRLRDYAQTMLSEGHIEATLDPRKSPGGFCSGSQKINKSFVYMSYGGSMGDVLTLAHEIGHAFHSEVLKTERVFHGNYPMTLAETASTFAEALMNQALLKSPLLSEKQKQDLKVSELNRHAAFLTDIPTRFEFEKNFHEERKKGFVPSSRITDLMLSAQKNWWGEWIEKEELDPFFWISKMHFYIVGVEFYNYPYTVGFLLSRLLSERFIADPEGFAPTYEAFLRETGRMSVEAVVQRVLGEDTRRPEFWLKGASGFQKTFEGLQTELGSKAEA
jgi:pepF/M3 family oligoendopeptidase